MINYRKDGTPVRMEIAIAPVQGGAGRVTHFVVVQNDVAERHAAHQALRSRESTSPRSATPRPGAAPAWAAGRGSGRCA